jgi:hypothetical protein
MAASSLALVALIVSSLVVCPCAGVPSAQADPHACCRTTSWRAVGGDCCGAARRGPALDLALSSVDGVSALAVAVAGPEILDSTPARASLAADAGFVLPPVLVLRI